MSTDIATQYAYAVGPGEKPEQIHRGDTVASFRGEPWTFEGVARKAYGGSMGRVAVSRRCESAYATDGGTECPHIWHRDGMDRREFFPSVFNLYLGTENGEEA